MGVESKWDLQIEAPISETCLTLPPHEIMLTSHRQYLIAISHTLLVYYIPNIQTMGPLGRGRCTVFGFCYSVHNTFVSGHSLGSELKVLDQNEHVYEPRHEITYLCYI